jgi:outer membrane translocation and assembly module TamA
MIDARIVDRAVSIGVVAFYDSGRVWQMPGDEGSFFDFHPAAGGGLRIDHRHTVLRFDFGTSHERAFNAYFTLGSAF